MPPSPLAPHGRARIFSILVGGFGRRGPISSPPLPSVALCALKDAALDLMRAPGRRAWLWALYPAPPCPPPQPRLRVRGGAPFFGGSKNHPLPLQSRKGVDFSPPKWEKRPFGGGGRERKIGGFAKKRGGEATRLRGCVRGVEGGGGGGVAAEGGPKAAAGRPPRGLESRGRGGGRGGGKGQRKALASEARHPWGFERERSSRSNPLNNWHSKIRGP